MKKILMLLLLVSLPIVSMAKDVYFVNKTPWTIHGDFLNGCHQNVCPHEYAAGMTVEPGKTTKIHFDIDNSNMHEEAALELYIKDPANYPIQFYFTMQANNDIVQWKDEGTYYNDHSYPYRYFSYMNRKDTRYASNVFTVTKTVDTIIFTPGDDPGY